MDEKDFSRLWINKIREELLGNFPFDYLENMETMDLSLPGKTLLLGQQLFGFFEIIDTEGNVFAQVPGYPEAKFYLYANRLKPDMVQKPLNEDDIERCVKSYESDLDSILIALEKDYKKNFPGSKNSLQISNQIFHTLNLQRY